MMEIRLKLMIVLLVGFPPVEMDLFKFLAAESRNVMLALEMPIQHKVHAPINAWITHAEIHG